MKKLSYCVLVVLICVTVFTPEKSFAAKKKVQIKTQVACDGSSKKCDGSVRLLSAGPVHVGLGQTLRSGLLVPAVQKAQANVMILNRKGELLFEKTVSVPEGHQGSFFDVFFDLDIDTRGEMFIGDGSVRTSLGFTQNGEELSVLIGLLLPAVQKVREAAARMHVGSLQLIGQRGETSFILPYIEQQGIIAILIGL